MKIYTEREQATSERVEYAEKRAMEDFNKRYGMDWQNSPRYVKWYNEEVEHLLYWERMHDLLGDDCHGILEEYFRN